jgi:hypothetical protein
MKGSLRRGASYVALEGPRSGFSLSGWKEKRRRYLRPTQSLPPLGQSPNAAAQFRCLSKHAAMRTASLLASHIKDTAGDGVMVVQNWLTRSRRGRQFRGVAATFGV